MKLPTFIVRLSMTRKKVEDVPGFCKVATIDDVKENDYKLTPGIYVGTEEVEEDGVPFEEKWKN